MRLRARVVSCARCLRGATAYVLNCFESIDTNLVAHVNVSARNTQIAIKKALLVYCTSTASVFFDLLELLDALGEVDLVSTALNLAFAVVLAGGGVAFAVALNYAGVRSQRDDNNEHPKAGHGFLEHRQRSSMDRTGPWRRAVHGPERTLTLHGGLGRPARQYQELTQHRSSV